MKNLTTMYVYPVYDTNDLDIETSLLISTMHNELVISQEIQEFSLIMDLIADSSQRKPLKGK